MNIKINGNVINWNINGNRGLLIVQEENVDVNDNIEEQLNSRGLFIKTIDSIEDLDNIEKNEDVFYKVFGDIAKKSLAFVVNLIMLEDTRLIIQTSNKDLFEDISDFQVVTIER